MAAVQSVGKFVVSPSLVRPDYQSHEVDASHLKHHTGKMQSQTVEHKQLGIVSGHQRSIWKVAQILLFLAQIILLAFEDFCAQLLNKIYVLLVLGGFPIWCSVMCIVFAVMTAQGQLSAFGAAILFMTMVVFIVHLEQDLGSSSRSSHWPCSTLMSANSTMPLHHRKKEMIWLKEQK